MHPRVFQYVGIILICALFGGGYWYWQNTQAAGVMTDSRPDFEAPLMTSLDLQEGTGIATYSRADGADRRATVTDFEGLIRPVKNGEARFEGARRVENLNPKSEADSGWTGAGSSPPTVQTSVTYKGKTAVSTTLPAGVNSYAQSRGVGSAFSIKLGSTYRTRFMIAADRALTAGEAITVYITGIVGMSGVTFSTSRQLTSDWVTYASDTSGVNAVNDGPDAFWVIPAGVALTAPITIYLTERQVEEISGQNNQNPSEYVSNGVLTSFPYHGAGVDGVKYFDFQNGTTVASTVVTDAKGPPISNATLLGYTAEGSRTNLALNSEVFDVATTVNLSGAPTAKYTAGETINASGGGSAIAVYHYSATTTYLFASNQTGTFTGTLTGVSSGAVGTISSTTSQTVYWTRSNLNVTTGRLSNDDSSVGGNAYAPDILTATAGNGTLLQSLTSASADRTFSIWLKRKTGTGNIDLTVDNGGTWTTKTITSNWERYDITQTAVTNPVFGIRIVTNGDEVYAWGAQLENASFASSYIPTTSASVTRAADALSYSASGNISEQAFTASVEFVRNNNTSGALPSKSPMSIGNYNSNANVQFGGYVGVSVNSLANFGSTWSLSGGGGSITYGVLQKVAFRLAADLTTTHLFRNGTSYSAISTDAKSANWSGGSNARIYIATNSQGVDTNQSIHIKNARIWRRALTDLQLTNLTSATDAISTSAVQQSTNLAPNGTNLLGHWSFDEGSGTRAEDFSLSGANAGTLVGSPVWVDGRMDKAISFDGTDDYVDVGSSSSLNTTADYTISMWVYNATGSDLYPTLLNRAAQVTNNGFFWIYTTGTNEADLNFQYADGTNYITNTFSGALGTNTWQHVMFTFDNASKSLKLYINGNQFSTTRTLTGSLPVDDGTLYLGTYDGSATNYSFQGRLDDVRIYARALTSGEVTDLYQSSAQTKVNVSQNSRLTDGLVGLWSFNGPDVSGTTAYDRSGQGNNGTLTSGPTPIIGKVGQGMNFNGTGQYMSILDPVSGVLDFGTGSFSVSVWGLHRDFTNPRTAFAFKKSNQCYLAGRPGWDIGHSFSVNGIDVCLNDGVNMVRSAIALDVGSRPSDFINRWIHAVIVFDRSAGRTKYYINGVKQANEQNISTVTGSIDNAAGLYVGSLYGWNVDGILDEVRIYNRALTANEINGLYTQGR